MPTETKQAIEYALQQTYSDGYEEHLITIDNTQELVDKVREYFNNHSIEYNTFSFADLIPYLSTENEEDV